MREPGVKAVHCPNMPPRCQLDPLQSCILILEDWKLIESWTVNTKGPRLISNSKFLLTLMLNFHFQSWKCNVNSLLAKRFLETNFLSNCICDGCWSVWKLCVVGIPWYLVLQIGYASCLCLIYTLVHTLRKDFHFAWAKWKLILSNKKIIKNIISINEMLF